MTAAPQTKQLRFSNPPLLRGSMFGCVARDATSPLWPAFLDAWLASQPALGTQLVGVAGPDGTAMARIRGFWLTADGRWDPSNRRMPFLVLPAARALARLRERMPSVSSPQIVDLYGEGYGSTQFEDLRALLVECQIADPCSL